MVGMVEKIRNSNLLYQIQLNILPALHGDCIHLRFGRGEEFYNIVVDSGPHSFAGRFQDLLNQIEQKKEKVNLLCLSHIDDDHIGGAEKAFGYPLFNKDLVERIWINLPEELKEYEEVIHTYKETTVGTAIDVWKNMLTRGIPFEYRVTAGHSLSIGPAVVDVLLPNKEKLDAFIKKWEQDAKRPSNQRSFLLTSGGSKDRNPYNGASITLCVTIGDIKILLTGDAHREDLETCCNRYLNGQEISIVKLPHHGSAANISLEMLKAMNCSHFIISTHETSLRPANKTLDILNEYGMEQGGVCLFGNYKWERMDSVYEGLKMIPLEGTKESVMVDGIEVYSE